MGVTSIILQKKLNFKFQNTLPFSGQATLVLHVFFLFCVATPRQSFPPCFGVGLLQLLCFSYTCIPTPQVTEHGVEADARVQSPQPPSTTRIKEGKCYLLLLGFFLVLFFFFAWFLLLSYIYILQLDKIEDVMCFKSEILVFKNRVAKITQRE